jgi:hypothetical protein
MPISLMQFLEIETTTHGCVGMAHSVLSRCWLQNILLIVHTHVRKGCRINPQTTGGYGIRLFEVSRLFRIFF